MGYLFLAAAIITEVIATLALRASDGWSKLGYGAIVVVGYVAAFALLSLALERGVPLAVAYALWAAIGVAAISMLSIPLFGESLGPLQVAGLVLIIGGVALLELGGAH